MFNDLYYGRTVLLIQVVSLLSSYVTCAVVFFTMGDSIEVFWRGLFAFYVFLNVILRSLTISFMAVLLEEMTGEWWPFLLYLISSFLATSFLLFVLQRKRPNLANLILNLIVSWHTL